MESQDQVRAGELSKVRSNSFFSFLSGIIRVALSGLMFIGVARFYGAETFGEFTTAYTYLTIIFLVADFGLDTILTLEIARNRDQAPNTIRNFFPLKVLSSLIASILMVTIAVLSHFTHSTKVLMFIFSSGILGTALTTFTISFFKGHEELHQETLVAFIQNSFLLISLLALAFLKMDIYYVAIVYVVSRYLGFFTAVFMAWPRLTLKGMRERVSRLTLFAESVPYGLHLLFGILFFQLDTILLAYWKGEWAVGQYQSVMKLIVMLGLGSDAITNALLPLLSRLHIQDMSRWLRFGKFFSKTLTFICLPFGLVFFIYPNQVITIVYGSLAFNDAVPILRIFAVIIVIRFTTEIYALMLTTARNQKLRMYVVVAATVLNLLFNSYAIPRHGIMGAAIVSLLTNIFVSGMCWYLAYAQLKPTRFSVDLRQMVVVAMSLTIVVAFRLFGTPSLGVGLIAVMVFLPFIYWYFGYTPDEREIMLSLTKFRVAKA